MSEPSEDFVPVASVGDIPAGSMKCVAIDRNRVLLAHVGGRFYAISLRLKRAGEEAAVLLMVWARQGQEWRIVSYLVITP